MIWVDVGPDEKYTNSVPKDTKWVVCWYERGDYCGGGEAVAYDGQFLYYTDLGHCSCYGPFDDGWEKCSTDEVHSDSIHSLNLRAEVHEKVVELLDNPQ